MCVTCIEALSLWPKHLLLNNNTALKREIKSVNGYSRNREKTERKRGENEREKWKRGDDEREVKET